MRWWQIVGIGLLFQPQQPVAFLVQPLAVLPLPAAPLFAPEPAPPVATAKPGCPAVGSRIALIGDSYGEGIGPHLKPLAAACDVKYMADGKRGTSVTQWATRDDWIGPVLTFKPTVVIVSLGGNDFLGDADRFQTAITDLVARIRAVGARVLWVSPLSLPYPDRTGVRQMWKDAVGDDWFPSEHLKYKRARDKVHTSYANYRDWAKRIWPWVALRAN